jgi:HK97 family phage major capsid protein
MSTNPRKENTESMEKSITTGSELSGGVLPEDLFDEFFEEVQNQTAVLNRVRTVDLPRDKMAIPKIGVGERLMQKQTEDSTVTEDTSTSTSQVNMDTVKTTIQWSLPQEAVEDTVDDVPDIVMGQMEQQFAVDAEDLGANGDESLSGFEAINDGWFTIAADRTSPVYYHDDAGDGTGANQAIDTSMFDGAIRTLDSKYLRTDPVFLVNTKHIQDYFGQLESRNDGIGVAVLQGDMDVNPFGYDIIGSPVFPKTEALFTAPENLIWGLHRDIEVDVLTESDEVFDNDLFAKYAIRARHDYEIEDEDAVVRIEGIKDPSA